MANTSASAAASILAKTYRKCLLWKKSMWDNPMSIGKKIKLPYRDREAYQKYGITKYQTEKLFRQLPDH